MNSNDKLITYNYKIQVNYTNNKEYRSCLRQVFRIDTELILKQMQQLYPNFDTFEDETKDELLFDEPKVNEKMDEILKMTIFAEPFRELYKKAASFVISESPDIGLAILLSYDYFKEFHVVLSEWFTFLELNNWDISKLQKNKEIEIFTLNSTNIKKLREHLFC